MITIKFLNSILYEALSSKKQSKSLLIQQIFNSMLKIKRISINFSKYENKC